MIFFKYKKIDTACFIPHLDTLRNIVRTLRRADIKMNFSQGFNPHMLLFLGNPISLGIESYAEYCAADIIEKISPQNFMEKFNEKSIENLKILKCIEVEKNPNIASLSYSALYSFEFDNLIGCKDVINNFLNSEKIIVRKIKKNGDSEYCDVKNLVFDHFFEQNKLFVNIASGNKNLKPDLLLNSLIECCNSKPDTSNIVKLKQFIYLNNNIVDADIFFDNNVSHSI